MHAVDYLKSPAAGSDRPVIVLHGAEASLKSAVLRALAPYDRDDNDDDGMNSVRLKAGECDWARVRDELASVPMFGGPRIVVIDDADAFVTDFRSQLEAYCDKPSRRNRLVIDVKTWKKNTRLAKRLDVMGLEIECAELTGAKLTGWLIGLAESRHGKQLTRDAAQLMLELAGSGMGIQEQELDKLASYVGERGRIGVEDVRQLVGGWKAETTWAMLDEIREGNAAVGLACLNKLLVAGEAAPRLLGGITYVFRKLGEATERARQGVPLSAALKDAGVFFRDIGKAEAYLRRIKRPRAERILARLLRADADLKGGSALSDRLQMELLLLWLAGVVD